MRKTAFYLVALGHLTLSSGAYALVSEKLSIHSNDKVHELVVEVAETAEQQEQGLMNRAHLQDNAGMLFLYKHPQKACFWMKNTPLSLDLIMINPQGRIVQINKAMKPNSLKKKCSVEQVVAVIEVSGGLSDKLNLKIGDQVTSPSLKLETH
jgi:uncharacterized membrane protein (UPF0127 family)